MARYLTYATLAIAVFSMILSAALIYVNQANNAKITSLQEEMSVLKNQTFEMPAGRGTVMQQSISKMTNLDSFTNENPIPDSDSRLDIVEKEISQLKSQVQKLSKSD